MKAVVAETLHDFVPLWWGQDGVSMNISSTGTRWDDKGFPVLDMSELPHFNNSWKTTRIKLGLETFLYWWIKSSVKAEGEQS